MPIDKHNVDMAASSNITAITGAVENKIEKQIWENLEMITKYLHFSNLRLNFYFDDLQQYYSVSQLETSSQYAGSALLHISDLRKVSLS